MRETVRFFIPGVPVQQGSKTAFVVGKRAVVTDQNKARLKPWRAIVAAHARHHKFLTFDEPVAVSLTFVMPRPARPRFNVPAVKPDIDKLVRAMLDGLTDGGLISDDARVVRLTAEERYATPDSPVGVHVGVTHMTRPTVFDYLLRIHPNATVIDDRTDPEAERDA